MADQTVYALLLRPVGQLLEALRIESFSLSVENEDLVVRDKTPGRKQITPREKALLAEWQVTHTRPQDNEGALKLASGILEWRMTPADIDRLEREGQSRAAIGTSKKCRERPLLILHSSGGSRFKTGHCPPVIIPRRPCEVRRRQARNRRGSCKARLYDGIPGSSRD